MICSLREKRKPFTNDCEVSYISSRFQWKHNQLSIYIEHSNTKLNLIHWFIYFFFFLNFTIFVIKYIFGWQCIRKSMLFVKEKYASLENEFKKNWIFVLECMWIFSKLLLRILESNNCRCTRAHFRTANKYCALCANN